MKNILTRARSLHPSKFVLLATGLVVAFGLAIVFSPRTYANHKGTGTPPCAPKLYDRCTEHGYFTNVHMGNYANLQLNRIWNTSQEAVITTKATFINRVETDLNRTLETCPTQTYNDPCVIRQAARTGAAFIVNTMLGQQGTDFASTEAGVSFARNNFDLGLNWRGLINYYDAQGLVNWDFSETYTAGQARPDSLATANADTNQDYGRDVAFYQNTAADTSRYIVFRDRLDPNNVNKQYKINKKCGNLTGKVTPPTPPPSAIQAKCAITAPSDVVVGSGFRASFDVVNTGTTTLNEADLSMQVDPAANYWTLQTFGVEIDPGNTLPPGGETIWSAGTFTAPSTAQVYPFKWKIMRSGVEIGSCSTSISVNPPSNRPIIRVNGGDMIAGADFAGYGKSCTDYFNIPIPLLGLRNGDIAARAHINTWGNLDYHIGGGKYAMLGGSASQYTVFSSGEAGYEDEDNFFDRAHLNHVLGNDGMVQDIDGVPNNGDTSNQTQPTPDGKVTKDGVFANDEGKGGEYGNYYDGLRLSDIWLPCVDISQYTDGGSDNKNKAQPVAGLSAAINSSTQVVTFAAPSGGTLTLNSGNTSALNPIAGGKKKVIIVDGNINIQSNITYPSTYNDINDIPFLQIIATGKINIYKSVTQIDAHLVAFPKDPDPTTGSGSGTIDTCADADTANVGKWPDGSGGGKISVNTANKSCNKQLVINGSLSARRIYFKRTWGTMSSDINNLDNSVAPYTAPNGCRIQNGDAGPIGDTNFDLLAQQETRCAAELINFYPEAYISSLATVNQDLGVQSVPIDSKELPPIY